jgi:hypothetical protein
MAVDHGGLEAGGRGHIGGIQGEVHQKPHHIGVTAHLLNRAQGSPFWAVIGTHGKNHNRSIYQKLEIASRDELIDDTPGDIT